MAKKDFIGQMGRNLNKNPHTIQTETKTEAPQIEETNKKKVGRPKTKVGDYKAINIELPVELIEEMNKIKKCYGNNLTFYVTRCIKNDLKANGEQYKQMLETLGD